MRIGRRLALLGMLCACGRVGFDSIDARPGTPSVGGPTLWLQMEEDPPTSGSIVDRGGGHVVRCLNDACPTTTTDAHGRGFLFSGREQLQIDWRSDLDGRMGYTIAVWARLDEAPAPYSCAFAEPNSTDQGDGNSFALCANASDEVYVYATSATPDPDATLTGARVELHRWHHLAATWDPAGNRRLLYVDGITVAADAGGPALEFDDRLLVAGADLMVTSGSGVDSYHWRGALDDLKFFPRALSDAEIQEMAAP